MRIVFATEVCPACPVRQDGTRSQTTGRVLHLRPQAVHEAFQAQRQVEQTPEVRPQYALDSSRNNLRRCVKSSQPKTTLPSAKIGKIISWQCLCVRRAAPHSFVEIVSEAIPGEKVIDRWCVVAAICEERRKIAEVMEKENHASTNRWPCAGNVKKNNCFQKYCCGLSVQENHGLREYVFVLCMNYVLLYMRNVAFVTYVFQRSAMVMFST